MKPIEIDVIGLQAAQAGLNRLHHILALVTAGVRVSAGHGVGVFRGEDDTLTMALHKFPDEGFAGPVGVDVGGVDKIAARFAVVVINLPGLVFGRAPAPLFAKRHGAERGFGNPKAAVTEKTISHGNLLIQLAVSFCLDAAGGVEATKYAASTKLE